MNYEQINYGSMKPPGYRPRIVDARISRLLQVFGGVEICGTKWCGKTWSALAAGESSIQVDLPGITSIVSADPAISLEGARPHVIDEWQEIPAIWDAARHAIDDAGGEKGLFLLTGSSTPAKDRIHHSGAGRIARIKMSTMTLWESGESNGDVSLAGLFDGVFKATAHKSCGLAETAEIICRGGWPGIVGTDADSVSEIVAQYLEAFFEVSIPKKGGVPRTARRMAASLARNIAAAATHRTIAKDVSEGSDITAADSTVSYYLDLFKQLYFIEELPGWDAPVRAKSRVRTKPKRYFADPSLAVSLLGMGPKRLLSDGQLMGLLFESLCVHDLSVYTSTLKYATTDSLRYYSDADGLEVDIIIELSDGRWAGIEVKLGEDKVTEGISNLERLRRKIASNPAARNPAPAFMAVITANSPFVRYDKESGVYVMPLTSLGP